ncbi:MAG TPA: acyl-CoA dehydrogenase family protein [Streptosporangiaceae bacterium]|nr:acyl-CoA dehydrogenase family protein [Streptosporangiaceae bacterium]
MDFSRNETQRDLAALSRAILTDRATPERLGEVEGRGDRFDPGLWADLAGAGVLAAALPESLGGAGLGLLEQCSVLAEIGRAVAPVPYLASAVLGAGALARFGTPEQQRRWAEPAGRGELLLTAALSEEDGDDPRAPAAVKGEWGAGRGVAGRWLLTGTKTAVPAGPRADLMLVPAATAQGTTVFLVTPGDRGVTIEPQRMTDGDAAGHLELAGVELPDDRVLGAGPGGRPPQTPPLGPPTGAEITDWLVSRGTVGLCAQQLGVLERALELTSAHANSRMQFGRPIGSFQAVAQRLADAYIDVEAVRLTMWQAAWRLSEGLPCDTEVATAKFWAADAGHRVAHTAVHVHGGMGVDSDHPLHRYFVAAKRLEFALGGATTQLRRIGAALARAN